MDEEKTNLEEETKKSQIFEKVFHFIRTPWITRIVIILAAAGVLLGVGAYYGYNKGLKEAEEFVPITTTLSFKDIGELATQSCYLKEVDMINDPRKVLNIPVPFTTSRLIVSKAYIVKAGYNFSEIQPTVVDPIFNEQQEMVEKGTITIELPEAKVLSNEEEDDKYTVYLEEESVFNNITTKEQHELFQKMKAQAEADAIENGLFEEARKNAELVLSDFVYKTFDRNMYEVVFDEVNTDE